MDTAEVSASAVIGIVVSLVLETLKQWCPAWFTGAVVSLVAFIVSVLVTLGWYAIGGLPDADSWQAAIRAGVIAFAAGQTFYGVGRKVGVQPAGAMAGRAAVVEPAPAPTFTIATGTTDLPTAPPSTNGTEKLTALSQAAPAEPFAAYTTPQG